MRNVILSAVVLAAFPPTAAFCDDTQLRQQATRAMRRAAQFFVDEVATEGGYLWRYSEDLTLREGEGEADDTIVWIQPPGTPAVGMAFLRAYEATGDRYYLNAAKQVGQCLVRGQLQSGGWDNQIHFSPKQRTRYAYRVDGPSEKSNLRNTTTLDDDKTQSALRLLMRLDRALDFGDASIQEAVQYALARLLEAQYPIGAWPQRFSEPPDAEQFPIRRASYPDSWSRTYPGTKYASFYTFNDNSIADTIATMFLAAEIYDEDRYRAAAERAGQFMLLAQMPEPQPAWAQQYDTDMHPAWARKFEPPAVTGGESHGVMRTLLELYRQTGDRKYLEPIPRAIAYLRRSELPDGRLARFHELKTNRPLYFTIDYQLTYSDADMPTHYAFKVSNGLDAIDRAYQKLATGDPAESNPSPSPGKASKSQIGRARKTIAAMDERGRWVEEGQLKNFDGAPTRRIIDCGTFVKNLRALSDYLATEE